MPGLMNGVGVLLVASVVLMTCEAAEPPTPFPTAPTPSPTAVGQIREQGPCNDTGAGACVAGFFVGEVFYTYTCASIRTDVVTENVLARGHLGDVTTELRRVKGVDPGVMAAVHRRGVCGQPAGKVPLSPWVAAFEARHGKAHEQAQDAFCWALFPKLRTSHKCS